MNACETGRDRLRAGLPADWSVGDKTGTGLEGAVNDVAIAVPPGHTPVLIASFMSESTASVASLSAAHAAVGRLVARGRKEPSTQTTPAAFRSDEHR
jgi:beta-lactamase class A